RPIGSRSGRQAGATGSSSTAPAFTRSPSCSGTCFRVCRGTSNFRSGSRKWSSRDGGWSPSKIARARSDARIAKPNAGDLARSRDARDRRCGRADGGLHDWLRGIRHRPRRLGPLVSCAAGPDGAAAGCAFFRGRAGRPPRHGAQVGRLAAHAAVPRRRCDRNSARRRGAGGRVAVAAANLGRRLSDSLFALPIDRAVGIVGGFLGGFAGLSAPAPLVWLQLRGGDSNSQRAIYQPFNLIVLTFASAAMAVGGQIGAPLVSIALVCLPATMVGAWIGARVYVGVSPKTFQRLVLCLLLASGCILL